MTTPGPTNAYAGRRGRPPIDTAARREELLDAAERVIARGPAEPSIAEIAAEAGYARTVVYAAFPNLPAVAYALTTRHTARMIAVADELFAQSRPIECLLRGMVDIICTFVEDNRWLYPLLMQTWVGPGDTTCRPLFSEIVDWATTVTTAVLAAAGTDLTRARPWASSLAGGTLLTAEDWNGRRDRSRDELVDDIVAMFWPAYVAIGADRIMGPIKP